MAVMAMFEGGPLDGEWKSMSDKEATLEWSWRGDLEGKGRAVYRRQEEMELVGRYKQAHYKFIKWTDEGGTKKGEGVLY